MKIIWEKKEKETVDYSAFDLKFKRDIIRKDDIYSDNSDNRDMKEKENVDKSSPPSVKKKKLAPKKKLKNYYIISQEYGL